MEDMSSRETSRFVNSPRIAGEENQFGKAVECRLNLAVYLTEQQISQSTQRQ